ncbi:preprotein translocase subunit SecG [bacterium]|nr:preprotein translocase subunit SecG [bacterium]MBU1637563.1 preprotein translocase subunit SecG [bacterium]MBU1920650.1 preprotein translocase subunit SecG [bacterium]
MLLGILLVIQVLISIFLVIVILLQSSKGGGLAGIAGGLTSSTVFGGRGAANFLTKATTVLATLFFINCLGMAALTAHTDEAAMSVTQQAVRSETATSPVPQIPGGQTINTETAPAQGTPAPATTTAEQPATQPTETEPPAESSGGGN